MPKRWNTNSLKEICHRRLALSFDKYWMTHYDQYFKDMPRLLYVIGPFESLSSETIQCMIDQLIETKCLKRHHFMCLLQESVTTLDLQKAGTAANNDSVLEAIVARCPKLVSLDLQGLNTISARAISELVKMLPGLKVLNLQLTNCNDQVMSVIGNSCRDLIKLNVSVTKVTNRGAFNLCEAGNQERGCTNLLQLRIFGTRINSTGALHLLQNLPELQYFGYDDVCGVVEMDQKERKRTPELKPNVSYKLRNLFAHGTGMKIHPVNTYSIELACKLCPDTVVARLYCCVTNDNILYLKTLKNLTSLDIGNSEGPYLTFEHGLLPVLNEIGHQLHELAIADMNDFDLWSIGYWCKNLIKLSILISGQIENIYPVQNPISSQEKDKIFIKLQHVKFVYPLEEIPVQSEAFLVMLKNAMSLKSITINYMQTLTSEMLLEVISVNPLNHLVELKLLSCDKIGAEPIKMMLQSDGCCSLSVVDLKNCRSITLQDFEMMKKLVKGQGFDILITWT